MSIKNIFIECINSWVNDWHHNRLLFWLEAVGTVTAIIASMLLNFLTYVAPLVIIFSLWLVGSLALSWAFYKRKLSSALVLMLFYNVLNVVGLTNVLF